MSPQEAAIALHAKLHAKDPRAWLILKALKNLEEQGSTRASDALDLIRQVHQHHKSVVHSQDDGTPKVGAYGFPQNCSAGVCFTPQSGASFMGAAMEDWGRKIIQKVLTPEAKTQLKTSMQRARASTPKLRAALPAPSALRASLPMRNVSFTNAAVRSMVPTPPPGPRGNVPVRNAAVSNVSNLLSMLQLQHRG